MDNAILVINAGSSSIKFAIFSLDAASSAPSQLVRGTVDGIGLQARFSVYIEQTPLGNINCPSRDIVTAKDHEQALLVILDWLHQKLPALTFVAAGHRVVHGGHFFSQPVRIDAPVLEKLRALIHLAPLHQPHALLAIEALTAQRPTLPQVACFDTGFHATMPWQEQRFALPRSLAEQGIRRYGFHGLSFDYISRILPSYLHESAEGRVVIAHLGQGVSMCALKNRQSIATTMSFTPLDGLPMGTRSGSIDPAIVFYLLEQGMTGRDIADLLHNKSGLLGLSSISSDMRTLLASAETEAVEAIEYFCYRIRRELGSLAAALGGLDAVVFTGGIGENAPKIRADICQSTGWLGIDIDIEANLANARCISTAASQISLWVIPTDEEQIIARSTAATLFTDRTNGR